MSVPCIKPDIDIIADVSIDVNTGFRVLPIFSSLSTKHYSQFFYIKPKCHLLLLEKIILVLYSLEIEDLNFLLMNRKGLLPGIMPIPFLPPPSQVDVELVVGVNVAASSKAVFNTRPRPDGAEGFFCQHQLWV